MSLFFPVFILALVQGITEFLPISSSGHLVLAHHFLGDRLVLSSDQEKLLDVATHVGTLLAVILYFRNDVRDLCIGFIRLFRKGTASVPARKARNVLIASVPIIIAGFILVSVDMTLFDSMTIMAWMTLIFGIILYIGDRRPEKEKNIEDFSMREATIYGLSQILALIPGVSRSGVTLTTGRFLGHSRVEAARFSLLLSIIAISGAGTLSGFHALQQGLSDQMITIIGLSIALSFVFAFITLIFFMRWMRMASLTPFAVYRVALGIFLLVLIYGGFIPQDM